MRRILGPTWCVTVPQGLIFTRRAVRSDDGATVLKASTPVVVGNCPWVSNCVGANNRKDFVQFLFYATLSQSCALGLLTARVVDWIRFAHIRVPHPVAIVFVVLDFCFILPVTLAVAGLLWYQVSCLIENLTTIEEYILERQQRSAAKRKVSHQWPYDLGCWRNWTQFFGSSVYQWFMPASGPRRDGLNFERRRDQDAGKTL